MIEARNASCVREWIVLRMDNGYTRQKCQQGQLPKSKSIFVRWSKVFPISLCANTCIDRSKFINFLVLSFVLFLFFLLSFFKIQLSNTAFLTRGQTRITTVCSYIGKYILREKRGLCLPRHFSWQNRNVPVDGCRFGAIDKSQERIRRVARMKNLGIHLDIYMVAGLRQRSPMVVHVEKQIIIFPICGWSRYCFDTRQRVSWISRLVVDLQE